MDYYHIAIEYYEHGRGSLAKVAGELSGFDDFSVYGGMWSEIANRIQHDGAKGFKCEPSGRKDEDGYQRMRVRPTISDKKISKFCEQCSALNGKRCSVISYGDQVHAVALNQCNSARIKDGDQEVFGTMTRGIPGRKFISRFGN